MDLFYLDNAATTQVSREVREAVGPWLAEEFGNPSSRHPLGVRAAEALDAARRKVARGLGARPAEVFFTSGGTEANNLAVLGLARARRSSGRHVLVGPTEHPSVAESAEALIEEGFEVERLRLDADGGLDLEHARGLLRDDTVLVAQMLVNNEFGTRYPVRALTRAVRAAAPRAAVHVDAVQGCGKLPVDFEELGCDTLAISGHKIHAPKGCGALVVREGVELRPLVFGGGQERGVRSGTENVVGIVALGAAVEAATRDLDAHASRFTDLRARFVERVGAIEGIEVLAAGEVVPSLVSLRLPGPPAEVWMHHLEARGVLVSAGSACHAKSTEISPALLALGLDAEQAKRVLRVSFSALTEPTDVERAGDILEAVCSELKALKG